MHKYEITMSNGDSAEMDTLSALLLAAETLRADSGGESTPVRVDFEGAPSEALLAMVRLHLDEVTS